jgi:putative ABC transport system permease protein
VTIIGVVSAVSDASYRPDVGTLYLPLRQARPSEFRLLFKLRGAAVDSGDALRAAAFAVDQELPLRNLQKLDNYLAALDFGTSGLRQVMTIIAFIAALLTISALSGLISRSVAQRVQEVGIRRALGATPWRATSMFAWQGFIYLCVAIIGVCTGVVVSPLLDAVRGQNAEYAMIVAFAVVAFMASIIGLASYVPCRRVVAVAPGDALRHD